MIFITAATEPTMILMLTEQDVADMRGGRTKFVDKTATKGAKFDKVVISLHKNQAEIEDILRRAGHGDVLKGQLPSVQPSSGQEVCDGCGGIIDAAMLLDRNCIACWREKAKSPHYS